LIAKEGHEHLAIQRDDSETLPATTRPLPSSTCASGEPGTKLHQIALALVEKQESLHAPRAGFK
jgi:hypothetical protein